MSDRRSWKNCRKTIGNTETASAMVNRYHLGGNSVKFKELECVRTLRSFPENGIQKGEIGVVLIAFTNPNEAYEVEFSDEVGRPKATFPILPEDIEQYE